MDNTTERPTKELARFQKKYLEESGFGTAGHLACHLILDGWSPESVELKTGLDAGRVARLFKLYPDRAMQWDIGTREEDIQLANAMILDGCSRAEVEDATGWSAGSVERQFHSLAR